MLPLLWLVLVALWGGKKLGEAYRLQEDFVKEHLVNKLEFLDLIMILQN